MTLRAGEVVLIRIEFHQTVGGKIRPAVALLDTGDDDFVAAPITSHPPRSDFDLSIRQWQQAGLNVPSTIRTHKLTVLSKDEMCAALVISWKKIGLRSPQFSAEPSGSGKKLSHHPRPMNGILVAITVMNWTFASSGRLAI